MSSEASSSYHVPLQYRGVMALGAACFLAAAITGIWRVALTRGFLLSPIPDWWPPHGHLMLGGFLAALIMFERMIGLRIDSLIWVPYAYALSAVFIHTGWWHVRLIHIAALLGWLAHRWLAIRKFRHLDKPLVESVAYITLSSALNYPGGLPARLDVALAALSFPIAAIAVERLEMSLNFRKTGAKVVLWSVIAWCVLWNVSVWLQFPPLWIMGVATLLLVLGIAHSDMTLRTALRSLFAGRKNPAPAAVQQNTLHGFLWKALLLAYVWLLFGSLVMIAWKLVSGAIVKDLLFHFFGLGFIFTMILAHAPIILASALGKQPPNKAPWVPFVVFQIMTIVRIAGDLSVLAWLPLWAWSGWITGVLHTVSFLLYVVLVFRSLSRRAED